MLSWSVLSKTSLSNKPYETKPMIILHGTIFIMYTKFLETAHFDLLKVISKRVESMANKFNNYVPNTSPNELAIIDLQMVCVRCNLSQSE
jgi:hypothetical protein